MFWVLLDCSIGVYCDQRAYGVFLDKRHFLSHFSWRMCEFFCTLFVIFADDLLSKKLMP